MKQKIIDAQFNDKNFWMMFSPTDAIEYFIPGYREYEPKIKFTIEDAAIQDRYVRHIQIWAEGEESDILFMQLKGFNK